MASGGSSRNPPASKRQASEPVEESPAKRSRRDTKGKGPAESPNTPENNPSPQKRARGPRRINKLPARLTTEGDVYTFGSGDCGQLGLGEELNERKKPARVKGLGKMVAIAAGGLHNLCVDKEGRVWSWGCNDQKALGRSGDEYLPGMVEGLEGHFVIRVACGDSISLALTDKGKLFTWGAFRNAEGILGFDKESLSQNSLVQGQPTLLRGLANHVVVDVAVGSDHVLALTENGDVYAWGSGMQHQLGRRIIPRRETNSLVPERIAKRGISVIGCGSYHSFAFQDGLLHAWGMNNFRQCGLTVEAGAYEPSIAAPRIVEALSETKVTAIRGGEHHTIVLAGGVLYAFGRADSGQLGLEESKIESEGDLGSASKSYCGQPTKVEALVKTGQSVVDVSVGSNHNLVLMSNGALYSFGFGGMHQLGTGSDEEETLPVRIESKAINENDILAIAAGAQHSMLLCVPKNDPMDMD